MECKEHDVVCIGGGGAGISAAIAASAKGANVGILSKTWLGQGDTNISAGNIACSCLDEDDTPRRFAEDIIDSGKRLGDEKLISIFAKEAPYASKMLESFGLIFNRDPQGRVSTSAARKLGGHSYARTLVSPARGYAICSVMRAAVVAENIDIYQNTLALKIIVEKGKVRGVICFRIIEGSFLFIRAQCVVLATGGACWLYYPHTNTSCSSTGDGYALALDAGAELIDMEQVQFGAFGLTHPESMTGQGFADPYYVGPLGRLLNKGGEVILENFSHMTRDQTTRVVAEEIHKAGAPQFGGLKLDLSPNLHSEEGRKMIAIRKGTGSYDYVRWAYGEDAYNLKEPWDIAPFAHYMMGGIRVDTFGETSVRGLYAAGEVQGGIHGANRLGSVALADTFVFGKKAGENAAYGALNSNISNKSISEKTEEKVKEFVKLIGAKGNWRPIKLQRELQETMWKKVGVIRFEKQLRESIQEIDDIGKKSYDVSIPFIIRYNRDVVDAIELRFMQTTAKAIALSALLRRETRGAHIRLDYPNERSAIKHTINYMEDNQIKVRMLSIN